MLVKIEGKVSSGAGYAAQSKGVGLDTGVLMILSRVQFLSASPQFLTKVFRIPPLHVFQE